MTPEQHMANASTIRDFISHPGMKILTEKLNVRSDSKRTEWLAASTPEEAEKIRQDSRCYALLMGILNEFLLRGENAERNAITYNDLKNGTHRDR